MTTVSTSSPRPLKELQEQLSGRLTQFRARVRLRLVVQGIAIFLAEVVAALLLTFILDYTLRLGLAARVVLLLAFIAGLGWEAWRRVVLPLRLRLSLIALAGALDLFPENEGRELAARVASVLELPRLLDSAVSTGGASGAMIERAVRRGHESLNGVDFDASLDPVSARKTYGLIGASVLIPLLLIALFPGNAGLWGRRLFLFSRQPWPQNTYLEVADLSNGRISAPRGEPYVLRAKARAGSVPPDRVTLTLRGGEKTTLLMKEFGRNDFRHDFAVVDQPLQLELEGGDDDLGPITLQPVDRPRIAALELTAQNPRQSAPEKHNFSGESDLDFLVRTRLSLAVTSNVPLRELRLKPATPLPQQGNVRRIDSTHFLVEWTHAAPARFDLELVAADTGLVSMPAPVSIGLKMDQPPQVTMAYSGVHAQITPQATIPLSVDARDDYGLKQVQLSVHQETPDPADPAKLVPHDSAAVLYPDSPPPAAAPAAPLTEFPHKHSLSVADMKLPAGALLTITADATDDCYTGAQTAHSRPISFRLVPPEELFREILIREQAERIKFRKQIEEAEKIRDAIRSVATAQQAGDLARRHRDFQRETLRIGIAMTETLAEIRLNALGSAESNALMEKNIIVPLDALQSEFVSPQTQALDTLVPGAAASADPAAVQAAATRQDQMVERMNQILKQMAQWDSFVDVLNQLDEIIKLETQVHDQSELQRQKDTEGVFDK